ALLRQAQQQNWSDARRRAWWSGEVDRANGALYEARGQYREAEAALRRVEATWKRALTLPYDGPKIPPDQLPHAIDLAIAELGRIKARQGRMAEGEADVRRALLSRLGVTGKFNLQTARYIAFLSALLIEQGRLADAEKLTLALREIHRELG